MSQKLSEALSDYAWLIVDALLLLLLLAALLAYNDFDDSMRTLFRGVFVAFWGYVWISGLHVLIYLRRAERQLRMPAVVSYCLFALKLALVGGVALWAYSRELL